MRAAMVRAGDVATDRMVAYNPMVAMELPPWLIGQNTKLNAETAADH